MCSFAYVFMNTAQSVNLKQTLPHTNPHRPSWKIVSNPFLNLLEEFWECHLLGVQQEMRALIGLPTWGWIGAPGDVLGWDTANWIFKQTAQWLGMVCYGDGSKE